METVIENEVSFTSDIEGKIENTSLPTSKPLLPLFELISNGIHAIEELKNNKRGVIRITLKRQGKKETLASISNFDQYPIIGFKVEDSGIGFNKHNYKHFLKSDTTNKKSKGGKGNGRFVCLKAFKSVSYESFYKEGETFVQRSFEMKPKEPGIFDLKVSPYNGKNGAGTIAYLNDFIERYSSKCPKSASEICLEIINHFKLYYLLDAIPKISLEDYGTIYDLDEIYETTFKTDILQDFVEFKKKVFNLYIVKSREEKANICNLCGHNRVVTSRKVSDYIPDFPQKVEEDNLSYSLAVYVTGEYLDTNVNKERLSFNFPERKEDDGAEELITSEDIFERVTQKIEELFSDVLSENRERKIKKIEEHIKNKAPEFRFLLKHCLDKLKRLEPDLSEEKLNIELYKIKANEVIKLKVLSNNILTGSNIENVEDYIARYNKYIEKENDIAKSDLANYIVQRKAIIDHLGNLLKKKDEKKYEWENAIHKLFFPMRTTSDDINYDDQNLWLIDDRFNYHLYLSSDKPLSSNDVLDELDSTKRADLLIFNKAIAFADNHLNIGSITIVEFKRPMRNDYKPDDPEKNPIDQVLEYIELIKDGNVVTYEGRPIKVPANLPFYAYIVSDDTSKLEVLLRRHDFTKTPDGLGYFCFKKELNAYLELITFNKLLKDAQERNKILFDKLCI
ncbi:hypothetical protein [Flavisolibacter tropicus]|uniref:ATP-binding protein n=1 Tax=Flavisolibacter tropicus TaxID=1492898 RepID=A0A172TVW3_9BACT|nr:hypothetical protein [Flavisolibacter tropicus]ANE50933.1 hypothetical protein SY85_10890 [Flavisolibacter tropicus]